MSNKIKIHFLGTNGWYDTKTGNTLCVLLETAWAYIVIDAGNGFYKLDRFIKDKRPIYLFLSHLHLDHIIGLHTLNKFYFPQGIDLFVDRDAKKHLEMFINKPFTSPLKDLSTPLRIHTLGEEIIEPLKYSYKKLVHSITCYGFRFEIMGKIVTFCSDTGSCDNIIELARNADLFISECSFKTGQTDKKWPHLNPEFAAKLAQKAEVKKLILVHFDANVYKTLGERQVAGQVARKIVRNTVVAKDNLTVII